MSDIYDFLIWKEVFSVNGVFKGDLCGVGFLLCLDGLNFWSKNKVNYLMWFIVLG